MPPRPRQSAYVLSLVRLDLAIVAVSNSWLMIYLAKHAEPGSRINAALEAMSLPVAMLIGGIMAAGLFVYGATLNDRLDHRHDSAFWPRRPIPSGGITGSHAFVVSVSCLLVALGAAVCLGRASAFLCLITAAAILFYNVAGKFFPALGIVSMGLIYAINMWIANPNLGFAWPIWLNMTHVMACSAVAYRLESKRPHLRAEQISRLWAGWAFWTMAVVASMSWRNALLIPRYPGIAPRTCGGGGIVCDSCHGDAAATDAAIAVTTGCGSGV